jgi:ribosome-binding protein aMBF1 (putative translation factor)
LKFNSFHSFHNSPSKTQFNRHKNCSATCFACSIIVEHNPHQVQGKNIFLSKKRTYLLQRYEMRRRRLPFSDAFAIVLKRNREAKNLSRQALSQKAGLHQTYVGIIERGLSNPSLDTANALAEALEIPFSKLIEETEKARNSAK